MKICMISGFANYSGGLENMAAQLTKQLQAKPDVSVTLYEERPPRYLPRKLWSFYHRRSSYHKLIYSLNSYRKLRTEQFNIIHGHGENCFFPTLFRNNTPFVMTFHGLAKNSMSKRMQHDPRVQPSFLAEKVAAENCTVSVACSQAVKEEMEKEYNIKNIEVIYNGVDTDKFTPGNKACAKQRLHLPLEKHYVLWVGHDPIRKGLCIAKETLKAFPNLHLITCMGKTPPETLIDSYNAADFLFFPTTYEGFPVVPMEALACGLPLLVSEASNIGEIVTQGKQGFIVNDGAYKEKIKLLQEPLLLSIMSENCRELALKYDWKVQAEKYFQLYRRIAS
jgi:alpha-maltose-1-phosphate synthase